jgi:hypothetical protein
MDVRKLIMRSSKDAAPQEGAVPCPIMQFGCSFTETPTIDEYNALHAVMSEMGFYRTIAGVDMKNNPKTFNLPHGVFYGASSLDASTLGANVVSAVKSGVQNNILVFVVESNTWSIGG